jgi:hypothetical protein
MILEYTILEYIILEDMLPEYTILEYKIWEYMILEYTILENMILEYMILEYMPFWHFLPTQWTYRKHKLYSICVHIGVRIRSLKHLKIFPLISVL